MVTSGGGPVPASKLMMLAGGENGLPLPTLLGVIGGDSAVER